MSGYDDEFYRGRDTATRRAAERVLPLVLARLGAVRSAVDLGCGVGTWLSVLQEKHGVERVQGYDGPWVDTRLLAIPASNFKAIDLKQPIKSDPRFDLAISLEVAEHLPPANALGFVRTLTGLSDAVLFSAAIPRQGGKHHVNEQWQSYWVKLFAAEGYACADCVRPVIWGDQTIAYWYRQNTLFFTRSSEPALVDTSPLPLDVVHPDLFAKKMKRKGLRALAAKLMGKVP